MSASLKDFSGDPVPAVRERDATGRVADLFADLRATLGMPFVNLVWRHLATAPAALDWTWAALKPLYRSGAIPGEAALLHRRMDLPAMSRWPAEAFRAVGLDATAEAQIGLVLRSYDRGNSMNLIAFSALLAHLDGVPPAGEATQLEAAAIEGTLPSLLDLGTMRSDTAALVLALNRLGQAQEGPILASLYRHLAHWPPYLALAWSILEPLHRDGKLAVAIAGTRRAAGQSASALLAGVGKPADDLSPEDRAFARAALTLFLDHGIARMTTIGQLLLEAAPAARAS